MKVLDLEKKLKLSFNFDQGVEAFERAGEQRLKDIKLKILVNDKRIVTNSIICL